MGAQPLILGYSDPDVNKAVINQLKLGSTFSLANKLEIEVAQLLNRLVPSSEQVRFGKNGADANTAAVKIAELTHKKRAYCFLWLSWLA